MRRDETTPDDISDEVLAALADDELPPADAAGLRARIEADPALAERYALFAETRALLGGRGAEDDAARLDRLAAAIRTADASSSPSVAPSSAPPSPPSPFRVIEGGGQAAPATTAAPRTRLASPRALPALAACLALMVAGALGYVAGRSGQNHAGDVVASIVGAPEAALASALERTPSGETAAWTDKASGLSGVVALVATHRLGDGRLCREYETRTTGRDEAATGLACRGPGGRWRAEIAAVKPAPGSGYATASGAGVIEGAIEALGGDGAMPDSQEKDLIASGWTPATR